MPIDPGAFLRRAVELGLLTSSQAARAGAAVRERQRSDQAIPIEALVVEEGLLDRDRIERIVRALRDGAVADRTAADRSLAPGATLATVDDERSVVSLLGSRAPVALAGSAAPVGRTGPKYVVTEFLGRGGMGEVLLAIDRDVGREVALKRILDPDREHVRRFVVEGQVTGQLEHPHIVPVYELGLEAGSDRPFLVMKRLRGRSLADVLDRALAEEPDPRTLHRLLEIFLKMCDAVAYAHSRGVIHRDLKPGNVMVGDFGEVHVVDWGLAKILGRDDDGEGTVQPAALDDAMRTREGQVSGTPMYMPPEQARGEVSALDERSDVYALGAILYQILALAPPFQTGSDLIELLTRVEKGRWIPLAERSLAPWPIPRELEGVVTKALARRQADRYATVLDLRSDVESYLAGRALEAVEYSPWQLLAKWARRHRTAVIGGAATAAALLLGLVATAVGIAAARRAEGERLVAVRAIQAEQSYETALEAWPDESDDFNPAAAQAYFLDRLPHLVEMGEALRDHPDPPDEWQDAIARSADRLQARAEEVGDWALAEHLAQLVGTWEAVEPEESERRGRRARKRREDRVAADLARLDELIDRIGRSEGKRPEQGGLLPGEVRERARLAGTLDSRREVAVRLLDALAEDNARLRRKWHIIFGRRFDEPLLMPGQRVFCVQALAVLGDVDSRGAGGTAPALAARTLEAAWEMRLGADELAAWVAAAARFEAVRPGVFRDPDLPGLIERTVADYDRDREGPVALAARRATAFLAAIRGREPLAGVEAATLEEIGEWAAASAAASREYTDRLLDLAGDDLRPEASALVLEAIGLRGDLDPPDPDRPDRASIPVVRGVLARSADVAVTLAAARALARLGDAPSGPALLSRFDASPEGSMPWSRLRLALRLLPHPEGDPEPRVRGRLAFLAGDLVRAREALDRAVALAPADPEIRAERARVRSALDDAAGALQDVSAAIETRDAPALRALRAEIRLATGDTAGALEDLDRAIETGGPTGRRLRLRARAHRYLGANDRALADLDDAIDRSPDDVEATTDRAALRRDLGRTEAALEDSTRAIALDPDSARAWLERGRVRLAQGDPKRAIEDLTRAIEISPDLATAFTERGIARLARGDHAGGLEDLGRAIELAPSARALVARGDALALRDHPHAAAEDYTRAIEIDPRDAEAWFRRAGHRAQFGTREEALADYDRAIELDPEMASAYLERAHLRYGKFRDAVRALDDLDQAIRLADSAPLRAERAAWLFLLRRYEEAAAEAERVVTMDDRAWSTWRVLAQSRAALGHRERAIRAYDRALELAPAEERARLLDLRRFDLGD